jgi:hypothetical protein
MAVMFLDPLLLGLTLAVACYGGAVWRGWFVRWFGRPDRWTAVAWPLPLLLIGVPVLAGGVLAMLGLLGVELGDDGTLDAAAYAAIYLMPLVGLAVWPPRWLLPGWARRRLTPLPPLGPDAAPGALPATQGRRGHGSRASWVWRVDAVAGTVWVEGGLLRFRALPGPEEEPVERTVDLDDAAIAELRFSTEGDLRLEPPRGGWWSRTRADVELAQVDACRVHARRPWRRAGLVTVEVEGRRPLQLWVADVRPLAKQLPTRP